MARKNKMKNDSQPMLLGLTEAIDHDYAAAVHQAAELKDVYAETIKDLTSGLCRMDDRLCKALGYFFDLPGMVQHIPVIEEAQEHILAAARLISRVERDVYVIVSEQERADRLAAAAEARRQEREYWDDIIALLDKNPDDLTPEEFARLEPIIDKYEDTMDVLRDMD